MGDEPLLNMDQVKIHPQIALCLPPALAIRRQILPFSCQDDEVFIACLDANDKAGLEAVQKFTGKRVVVRLADPESLSRAISRVYNEPPKGSRQARGSHRTPYLGHPSRSLDVDADDAVELANKLLHAAILRQASDIHIDPEKEEVRIRFRVDGELDTYCTLPHSCHPSLISRLKVLSGMDIAEKRAPQDGGFSHRYGSNRSVDIRSASLPTRHGERMTLRLLALGTESLTLDNLGMRAPDHQLVKQLLRNPHGLILFTGPTGSGKTTTLYAIIRQLVAMSSLNILTIEDPIEYEISRVAQVEVEAGDKVNFEKALRSILRHDPDVLMIGEIRDLQTLDVAIKASLTGHLVLSTVHTNSAAGAVTRLVDMGAQKYLVAATLRLSVAQRLVRKLCQYAGCKRQRELTREEAELLRKPELAGTPVFDPGGCMYCDGRGYSGRVGLFELMPLNAEISPMITAGAPECELEKVRRSQGHPSLMEDGIAKVLAGMASFADVIEAVDIM